MTTWQTTPGIYFQEILPPPQVELVHTVGVDILRMLSSLSDRCASRDFLIMVVGVPVAHYYCIGVRAPTAPALHALASRMVIESLHELDALNLAYVDGDMVTLAADGLAMLQDLQVAEDPEVKLQGNQRGRLLEP